MDVSDARLMEGIVAGDESAFLQFYQRHSLTVIRTLFRILREPADAEDVMQEAFLQLWNRAEQYDPNKASPLGWLILIARSRALDLLRRRKPGQMDPNVDPGFEPDMSLGLIQDESRAQVRSALMRLPPDQREVIRLAFLASMTHEQIAASLGMPLGTVKTRIRLGLHRMKTYLPATDAT
ncbi:MAG: RNA polymerase sigma factor [Gemmataceae bacterium]